METVTMAMAEDGEEIQLKNSIFYKKSSILGKGPKSAVYRGRKDNLDVAVKRVLCENVSEDERRYREEFFGKQKHLFGKIEQRRHPNTVGFYECFTIGNVFHLVMELCHGTLKDYISIDAMKLGLPPFTVVKSMANGLEYLHSHDIAHCDLKPENVLFVWDGNIVKKAVLGDFGTAKNTLDGMYSLSSSSIGSLGYIPYELCNAHINMKQTWQNKLKFNQKSDIFPLGCLFHYTISNGKHPFDATYSGQGQIEEGKEPNLCQFPPHMTSFTQLLFQMLNHGPDKRPTANQVLIHPSLWELKEVMTFFNNFSNALETVVKEDKSKGNIIEDPNIIPKCNFLENLPEELRKYLSNYTPQNSNKKIYFCNRDRIRYLLRAIRNTEEHFRDLPESVRKEMGSSLEDHAKLWTTAVPDLLMYLYGKRDVIPVEVNETVEDMQNVDYSSSTSFAARPQRTGPTTADDNTGNQNSPHREQTEASRYVVPTKKHELSNLLYSVKFGKLADVKRHVTNGIDATAVDYDNRNALHVAAAEGKLEIVQYLVDEVGINRGVVDRWGFTAYDEASRFDHETVTSYLKQKNEEAPESKTEHTDKPQVVNRPTQHDELPYTESSEDLEQRTEESWTVVNLIYSAYYGDLQTVESYANKGMDLSQSDYDGRTALHLAATEGHEQIVRYLLNDPRVKPHQKDRWDHTAYDEANGKHQDVADLLLAHMNHVDAESKSQTHVPL